MPCGRQLPLGYNWHNRRPLAGGVPHLLYKGFAHRTVHPPSSDPQNFQVIHQENMLAASQGAAGLHRGIWSQARSPMQSCQRTSTVHGPMFMTTDGGDVMEASLLGPVEEEPGTPTQEEEADPPRQEELRPQETLALLPNKGEECQICRTGQARLLLLLFSLHPHRSPSLKRGKSLGRDQHWP